MPDLYAELEVPKDADKPTIKKAYRKKARAHHPDANRNDCVAVEKFHRVQTAYDVLMDDRKRAEYDRFGESSLGTDLQKEALKVLANLVVSIADANDARRTHIIKATIDSVRETQAKGGKQIRQFTEAIANLREAQARLTRRGELHEPPSTNPIAHRIAAVIEGNEANLKQVRYQMALGDEVLKLLAEYDYRIDPPDVPDPWPVSHWMNLK